jgi:hypothetical protein
MLYSKWLETDGQKINYSFYDANATIVHKLNSNNTVLVDFYHGSDDTRFSEGNYFADIKARWGNIMGAAHWMCEKGELSLRSTAYVTSYKNRFSLEMLDMTFRLPSSITDLGLKSNMSWKGWNTGIDMVWHSIHPQSLEHEGDVNVTDGHAEPMHSLESSLYGSYEYPLFRQMKLIGGIRGSLFKKEHVEYWAIDPSMRLVYDNYKMQFAVTYALRHQYLFQTGFSDSGLPTEFWISASDDYKPQYAHELSANGSIFFFKRRYRLTVDLFYRRLFHQLAYKGSILDYVNSHYPSTTKALTHIFTQPPHNPYDRTWGRYDLHTTTLL